MKACLVTDLEVTLLEEDFHCVSRMMLRNVLLRMPTEKWVNIGVDAAFWIPWWLGKMRAIPPPRRRPNILKVILPQRGYALGHSQYASVGKECLTKESWHQDWVAGVLGDQRKKMWLTRVVFGNWTHSLGSEPSTMLSEKYPIQQQQKKIWHGRYFFKFYL